MGEMVYLSISFDNVSSSEAEDILQAVLSLRGTKHGMNVYYDKPVTGGDDDGQVP